MKRGIMSTGTEISCCTAGPVDFSAADSESRSVQKASACASLLASTASATSPASTASASNASSSGAAHQKNRSLTDSWAFDLQRIEQRHHQGATIKTSIMSTATTKPRGGDGDGSSEEAIIGADAELQYQFHDPSNQIRRVTEVTVENRDRDEMGSLKTERGM